MNLRIITYLYIQTRMCGYRYSYVTMQGPMGAALSRCAYSRLSGLPRRLTSDVSLLATANSQLTTE